MGDTSTSTARHIRQDKCGGYAVKETLGFRGGKSFASTAEREENQRGAREEAKPQTKNFIKNSELRNHKNIC